MAYRITITEKNGKYTEELEDLSDAKLVLNEWIENCEYTEILFEVVMSAEERADSNYLDYCEAMYKGEI